MSEANNHKILKTVEITWKNIDSLIELPNMHILIEEYNKETISGHCLDFDTWAYSQESNIEKATSNISKRLIEMALNHIFLLYLDKKIEERLYRFQVPLESKKWKQFNKIHNDNKASILTNSLKRLLGNQKPISNNKDSEKQITKEDLEQIVELIRAVIEIPKSVRNQTLDILIEKIRRCSYAKISNTPIAA